jgi:creatinine amidohydrolase
VDRSPAGLAARTWRELAAAASSAPLLLAIPLGSTEQHGPHLPLGTDTSLAHALAHSLAARRHDVVVAPALPYGSSGEHAAFPGTLSIGQAALELVLVELVRSADAFAGVVLVNGHGGNVTAVARASEQLRAEGRGRDIADAGHGAR